MPIDNKIDAKGTWWDASDPDLENPPTDDVDLRLEFDGETFFIDGLRDDHYISIELKEFARAMVEAL